MKGWLLFIVLSVVLSVSAQEFEPYSIDGLKVINEFVVEEDSTADSSYDGLQKIWWSDDSRFAITESSQFFAGVRLKLWDVENRVLLKSFKTEKFDDAHYYSISNNILNVKIGENKITVLDDENEFILDRESGLIESVKSKSNKSKIDELNGKEFVKGVKTKVVYHNSIGFKEPDYLEVNGNRTIKLPEGLEDLKLMTLGQGDSVLVSLHYSFNVSYQKLIFHDLNSEKIIGSYSIDDRVISGIEFINDDSELVLFSQKGKVSFLDLKGRANFHGYENIKLKTVPQSGHAGRIKSVEFSSDGKNLLTLDESGMLLKWDWQRGIHGYPKRYKNVRRVDFINSESSDIIVNSSITQIVDNNTGKVKHIIENTGFEVVSNKDCSLLVYYLIDYMNLKNNGIFLVDLKTNKQRRITKELKQYYSVTPIALNSKGNLVAIDCSDLSGKRSINVVSLKTGKIIRTLPYEGLINQADFNSKDKLILGFIRNGILVVDCLNKSSKPLSINVNDSFGGMICSVVADDYHVYASGYVGRIGVWNLSDGRKINELYHYDKPPTWLKKNKSYDPEGNIIQSIDISSDGKYLVSSSYRGTIKIWSLKNFKLLQTLKARVSKVTGIKFEPNNQFFRVSNSSEGNSFGGSQVEPDSTIKRIDFQNLEITPLNGHRFNVIDIVMPKSKNGLVSFDNMNGLKFWNDSNKVIKTVYTDIDSRFTNMEFSPEGEFVAVAFNENNGKYNIQIFSNRTYDIVIDKEIKSERGFYLPLVFLSEKELLVSSENEIYILDIKKKILRKWTNYHFDAEKIKDIKIRNNDVIVKLNYTSLAFSKDGELKNEFSLLGPFEYGGKLAISDDKSMYLYDDSELSNVMKYNTITESFSAPMEHPSPTTCVDVLDDKMIVGTYGGSCFLWDLLNEKMVAQFIPNKSQEMSVVTDGGYYFLSSKTGMSDISFQYGHELFPLSQFDLKYNRPDIVLERLGYASPEKIKSYRRAYEKRLQKMGFTEDMLKADFHLPEASILNENDIPVQIEDEVLKLNIKATDSKYLLDRINVWINNVPIYGVNGISLRDKNTQDYKTEIELQLNKGDNKVEVSVLNQAGAESYKETVYINCTKPAPKPNLYFVGVGVKDYVNEDMNLKFSDKDIRDIAHLYGSSSTYGKVYIDTFLNASATKNILPQIRQRLESTTIHDQVIFMYSGHGILDDSLDYYLTTHDIDFLQPSTKGIPYEAVDELLDNIPARQKLVLIDACNSGEVDKDEMEEDNTTGITAEVVVPKGDMFKKYATKTNSFEMMQELFTDLRRGTGATVISSSSGKYFSFEDKKYQNGVYTYALKLGLEGAADVNGDNEITVSELKGYLYTKVEELTNGKQKPTARQENLEYDFRVW